MNLLIVEDDARVADFLSRGLKAEGYGVRVAITGPEGLAQGQCPEIDAIILDVMLPGLSGMDVCQQLRRIGVFKPILMLSALSALEEKVEGLGLGADDYLAKPFAFDELLARIAALLRRARGFDSRSPVLQVGDLIFNREQMNVARGERKIDLTAKELAILELLMNEPGKVFSRERILSLVWGYDCDPLTNIVDVYIARLRRKIDLPGERPLIATVRGFGYRLAD
jgi:DNA-binding response OmpR family regulator